MTMKIKSNLVIRDVYLIKGNLRKRREIPYWTENERGSGDKLFLVD